MLQKSAGETGTWAMLTTAAPALYARLAVSVEHHWGQDGLPGSRRRMRD